MFSTILEYSKKTANLLTGKEIRRIGVYTVPQFGPSPAKDKDTKYTDAEAVLALQEAVNYFGADEIVRHLNWAMGVATQRKSNNDLRTAGGGSSEVEKGRVTAVLNLAKRYAEMEVGVHNADGDNVVDRKSAAYAKAIAESISATLAIPKWADLRPAFEGSESGKVEFNLMAPGSFNGNTVIPAEDDEAPEA